MPALFANVQRFAESYQRLADDGHSDVAGTLQQAVLLADERYKALQCAVTDMEQQLASIVKKKTHFDDNRDTTMTWLHGLDTELKTIEALPASQLHYSSVKVFVDVCHRDGKILHCCHLFMLLHWHKTAGVI